MHPITAAALPAGGRASPFRIVGAALAALAALARAWRLREAERRGFARMDDRMLRDIGVGRAELASRLDEPFWRA